MSSIALLTATGLKDYSVYLVKVPLLIGVTCLMACVPVSSVPPSLEVSRTVHLETATTGIPLRRESTPTPLLAITWTPDVSTPTLSLDDLATVVARETVPPTNVVSMDRQDEAARVLDDYLGALAQGDYERADALYGGSFEPLWGLTIFRLKPDDRLAIWATICDDGYLQCLPVRNIAFQWADSTAFRFKVSFKNLDGSLFVVGPCCGGNVTDHPPVSLFDFEVVQSGNALLVVGLPPYVP